MSELIPAWPLMTAFLVASLVLTLTPGPAVVYIVTRTLAQGRPAGLASVAGVALGNLGNAIGAALGLAALFAISSLAFTAVKYAGAAYLIYLGVKTLRTPAQRPLSMELAPTRLGRLFRDGFVVALLNPKTTIFFAAFLPQFMHPGAPAMPQSVLLGVIFVVIAVATDSIYVLAASMVGPALMRMRGAGTAGRYVTASAFIGLGVFTATTGERAK